MAKYSRPRGTGQRPRFHVVTPIHRETGTSPNQQAPKGADAERSAASDAGSTITSRFDRNIVTSVGPRTTPRKTRRVRAAKLETQPNASNAPDLQALSRSVRKRRKTAKR